VAAARRPAPISLDALPAGARRALCMVNRTKGKAMTSDSKHKLCEHELRQFTGSELFYQHRRNLVYTEGVRHVANQGGAYWLIDAISSWIGSQAFVEASHQDDRIGFLHFWNLEVHDDKAAVLAGRADSPDEPFIVQSIPYSDFPLKQIEIWAAHDGRRWTLYLPCEH